MNKKEELITQLLSFRAVLLQMVPKFIVVINGNLETKRVIVNYSVWLWLSARVSADISFLPFVKPIKAVD